MKSRLFQIILLLAISGQAVAQDYIDNKVLDREIIINSRNIAQVSEKRALQLESGNHLVRFENIPDQIEPEFIKLSFGPYDTRSISSTKTSWTIEDIWKERIGEHLKNEEEEFDGILKRFHDDNLFLETPEGKIQIISSSDAEDLLIESLPSPYSFEPAILWECFTKDGLSSDINLSYFLKNISWTATYSMVLSDGKANLQGEYVISNDCGTSLDYNKITFLAGDIHLAGDSRKVDRTNPAPGSSLAVDPTQFGDMRRYSVEQDGRLLDKYTTLIPMLTVPQISYEMVYVYDATIFNDRVSTQLKFTLDGATAKALPAGTVRIFQGSAMIGEDKIDHTPPGSEINLNVAQSFDLTAKRERISEKPISDGGTIESYKVTLGNSKTTGVLITVLERVFGNWTVPHATLNGSAVEAVKRDARTVQFDIPVPAGETVSLTYDIRYER
ncbi:hypothetical protein K8I28_09250 [bacterium]|nr:hypothetical protein [bacterium]